MALTNCTECGGQMSEKAVYCPHCGAPNPSNRAVNRGGWRNWGYEWKSQITIWGYPLIHVAIGWKNGRLRVARGVIAIGQFALGLFTIAQFGVGLLFGFGQFIFGLTAIAQFAIAILFGLGQFSTGYVAIGQLAFGYYVLTQVGFGEFVYSTKVRDPEALEFFRNLLQNFKEFLRLNHS